MSSCAAGGGNHGVDVVCINDGDDMVLASFTSQDQALFLREVLSFAPKFRLKRYMGKGFLDLPFCSPACSSMLSIAHSFGFDIVQRTLPGEMCGCSDEQEAQTTDNNKNNLSRHIFLLLI